MKTIFKTMSVAVAILMTAGCGNTTQKQVEQTAAMAEEVLPSVAVEQNRLDDVRHRRQRRRTTGQEHAHRRAE